MSYKTSHSLVFASLAALILSGCAASSDRYPSLAIRDFEKINTELSKSGESDSRLIPVSADVMARLSAARQNARDSNRAFQSSLAGTRSIIAAARGTGTTSNNWAVAQLALANLHTIRSRTALALAEIDAIYATVSTAEEETDLSPVIQTEVAGLIAEQDRILMQLNN